MRVSVIEPLGDPSLERALADAVDDGLTGVALVDRRGRVIAIAGALAPEEAMPLVSLIMYRHKEAHGGNADLAARMFGGEVLSLSLDDRDVALGVARRQLFVVAVLGAARGERVRELRDWVASQLADDDPPFAPHRPGGGDGGTGPAELLDFSLAAPRAKA
jgi:hypothetical protein